MHIFDVIRWYVTYNPFDVTHSHTTRVVTHSRTSRTSRALSVTAHFLTLSSSLARACAHIAACCSVLQRIAVYCSVLKFFAVYCSVLQRVAVHCSALQCIAVYCSARLMPIPATAAPRMKRDAAPSRVAVHTCVI